MLAIIRQVVSVFPSISGLKIENSGTHLAVLRLLNDTLNKAAFKLGQSIAMGGSTAAWSSGTSPRRA